MAQSVGNYLTLEDYLKVHSVNSMRLLFWLSSWINSTNLTDDLVEQAELLENRIDEFLSTIRYNLKIKRDLPKLNNNEKIQIVLNLFDQIDLVLDNEFRTDEAIRIFSGIITEINKLMKSSEIDNTVLELFLIKIKNILHIIGFQIKEKNSNDDNESKKFIRELIELRTVFKKNKQYQMSDYIRDIVFPKLGYSYQDLPEGPKINKLSKLT